MVRELTRYRKRPLAHVEGGDVERLRACAFGRPRANGIGDACDDHSGLAPVAALDDTLGHARQRSAAPTFQQSVLQVVKRLSAAMVNGGKADARALFDVRLEIHEGKRR